MRAISPASCFDPSKTTLNGGNVVSLQCQAHCASCAVRTLCLPAGLDSDALGRLNAMISARLRVRRKDALFRAGDRFHSLYAIRLGAFKTVVLAENGLEQVTGYHLPGDILGTEGAGDYRYPCQVVALEDSEVCVLPFEQLDFLCVTVPALRRNLYRVVSRNLCRDNHMMLLLGCRPAEERLTIFLLDVGERYRERGYSAREFVLRMTRNEIASYLGLKLETVSRLFSRLQAEGLLQVQGRAIKLLDPDGLQRIVR